MNEKIEIIYKGTKITFDTTDEEWVARLNVDVYSSEDTFKKHKSLQKLKDAIDRFNKKNFQEIPIILFDKYGENDMKHASIISFTNIPGECWIRYGDGRREKINTVERRYSSAKKIYACGNEFNEPILIKIMEADNEIKKAEESFRQKEKEKIHLIDSLQYFDIGGYAELEEEAEEENEQ